MAVILGELRDTDNAIVMDSIRSQLSNDYQRRIPEATKAGISEAVATLHKFSVHHNEFVEALVNRIGSTYARNMTWSNPLAEFKRGMLEYGDTIQEIQVGLLQSYAWDPDREYMERVLFERELPEVQSSYHTVNRQEFYKVTINNNMLRRAFLEQGGLADFASRIMEAPITSDNWDEFLATVNLFSEYEKNGGFYHVHIPNISWGANAASEAKHALRKMRGLIETMKFPSTKYNAAHMPTFAKADDLALFTTPEFAAGMDVEALAGAFNIDKANVASRMITVPRDKFNIGGAHAVITTKDFFLIADTMIENTSQWNPAAVSNNYFFHHHQIISASRFVPAVLLWEGADDEVIEITSKATAVAKPIVTDSDGKTVTTVLRGGVYQATAAVTDDNPNIGSRTGIIWSVANAQSTHTHVSATGVVSVGCDEDAESIRVVATTSPRNGEGITSTATVLTVAGDRIPAWPDPHDHSEPEPDPIP